MNKNDIINAFSELSQRISKIDSLIIEKAQAENQWFTETSINNALNAWQLALNKSDIEKWLNNYSFEVSNKKIGIIMAGNIPLVGLHDLLCVLALGYKAIVKPSSQDQILMKEFIKILTDINPYFIDAIIISDSLKNIDGLIATGSNNSARYFEYYFRDIPKIIRKNRTSLAVLTGNETDEELKGLANDIYQYFGLGCRNVTHLILPKNIDLKRLYESYDLYIDIVNHHKYYNNYMYHKSILLMNLDKHYDNGFMLYQEKETLHAPIATLNYHYYNNIDEAITYIKSNQDSLQCVVSHSPLIVNSIAFGASQKPSLWDYADNVNVLDFLKTCN